MAAKTEQRTPRGRAFLAAALLFATTVAVLSVVRRAEGADDIDLLRERGGTPFVMVIIDSSASMTLSPPGAAKSGKGQEDPGDLVPAAADDPASKFFQIKKALYEVFKEVENVHFGLATFNQDHLWVRAKHWVYAPTQPGVWSPTFTYPTADPAPAGVTKTTATRPLLDSYWVFGPHIGGGVAGTCQNPIDFADDNGRIKLNRFPHLGETGGGETRQWLEVGNRTFLLESKLADASPGGLGDEQILVDLTLSRFADCDDDIPDETASLTIPFRLVTDFLMVEADVTGLASGSDVPGVDAEEAPIGPDDPVTDDTCTAHEAIAGFWNHQDIVAINTCGAVDNPRPHTGRGWEGSTDSGARDGYDRNDACCLASATATECEPLLDAPADIPSGLTCVNLHFPTTVHPSTDARFRLLDVGDHLPLSWEVEHRDEFLRRLNPRHPDYVAPDEEDDSNLEKFRPYFSVASYFQDTAQDGLLRLQREQARPLLAYGNSPLGRAINDFRCWVLGADGNKCKGPEYQTGWNALFAEKDIWFGCRVPYLIVISDGEENSKDADPTSDVSDFSKSGFKTFAFTFEVTSQLQSMVNAGGGELILVNNGDELKEELKRVIGTIEQEARTFATAAVPSVQASTEQNIYITHFLPRNEAAIWEGHVRSFPSRPDLDLATDTPNWDAATAILSQAPEPPPAGESVGDFDFDLDVGPAETERRILFAADLDPENTDFDSWPANRRLFLRTAGSEEDLESTEPLDGDLEAEIPAEEDFWNGLALPFDSNDGDSVQDARRRAHKILGQTVVEKQWEVDGVTRTYVLGENFHSDPLVVGSPANTRYFVQDAEETLDGDGNPIGTGYQEFFNRHENRRKVVIAGANDGMLHAFDAGQPELFEDEPAEGLDPTRDEIRFSNGTGKELFAFIPRPALPIIAALAENPVAHRWSLDAPPVAGDVFIDPLHEGTPTAAEREWRTVLIGGFREGGAGYFALDITQPDRLDPATVGPTEVEEARRDVLAPLEADVVPECFGTTGNGGLDCGALKYPAPLWEFTDRIWHINDKEWVELDEDGNEFHDLGESWSVPDIGRMKVVEDGATVNKYVAVFGGGLDPAKVGSRGNWLYIADVETGETIYKGRLEGSAPSSPAAIDVDQDGFLDRIYLGTTAGLLYRVDLVHVNAVSGELVFPALEPTGVLGLDGEMHDLGGALERIDSEDPLWAPRAIFTTGGRPIYFPPAALFVADLGEFALAFGTGDRDDLTVRSETSGRFYVFVDETESLQASDLPMTEDRFEEILPDEADNPDLLTNPGLGVGEKGWFLVLNQDERLIGNPFGFSGITFFATFETADPQDPTRVEPGDPQPCEIEKSNCDNPACKLDGLSRIYVVGTTDADAFLEVGGVFQRFREIEGFVTNPFTEQALHTTSGEPGEPPDEDPDPDPDPCPDLTQKLQPLFPPQCKFGNHRIDIKVIRSEDVSLECIASVPICIIEKNWKEIAE